MSAASSENVTVLTDGDKKYFIIGTAHVSQASVDEVGALIDEVAPDAVCVELCQARYNALTDDDRWRKLDIFKVIREGKTLFLLANLAIGAYQRKLGQALGVKPGAEMIAAAERAVAAGMQLELVDRDIHITLKRTWGNLSFRKKWLMLTAIFGATFSSGGQEITEEDIEQLKQPSHLSEMMAEFARQMPDVKEPLIDERDRYLISRVEEAPGDNVVVVVGAGHVPGMKANFNKPIDRALLEVIPKPSRWLSALKWVIPSLILCAFAWGYFKHQGETLSQMLYAWVLPNSVFAGLFTAVAGGKILSVITAFFISPITSLNPMLGAGMVVGLLEAWLRKPTVADAERINDDVKTLRGFYRNPFTRVLLVVVGSTFGSALGAWIGLPWVLSHLGG